MRVEHAAAQDFAVAVGVRIWMSTLMEPRSVTAMPAFSATSFFAVGPVGHGLQD
jgi:hypothetical protein